MTLRFSTLCSCWVPELVAWGSTCSLLTQSLFLIVTGTLIRYEGSQERFTVSNFVQQNPLSVLVLSCLHLPTIHSTTQCHSHFVFVFRPLFLAAGLASSGPRSSHWATERGACAASLHCQQRGREDPRCCQVQIKRGPEGDPGRYVWPEVLQPRAQGLLAGHPGARGTGWGRASILILILYFCLSKGCETPWLLLQNVI